MKDLIIIGAGDFGREAIWIAERMNEISETWNILGFVDDNPSSPIIDGYPVLGNTEWLSSYNKDVYCACAIANGNVKERIWSILSVNSFVKPAILIDPSVIVGKGAHIGKGSIISANVVLAIASNIGKHCIINIGTSIGHDSVLKDFCTIHPGSNISGKVIIGKCSVIGTGTKIIQGREICPYVITGAGAVVVKDITEPGTYVGCPVHIVNQCE